MWDRLNLPMLLFKEALPVQALALPPWEASASQATALPPREAMLPWHPLSLLTPGKESLLLRQIPPSPLLP